MARLRADQDAAEGLIDEDTVPEVPETPVTVTGDLWVLGPEHRLLCGDATVAADVQRLMAGAASADLVFTDPPYNVRYEGYTDQHLTMQGDRMTAEQFQRFLGTIFANYRSIVKRSASLYTCHRLHGSENSRTHWRRPVSRFAHKSLGKELVCLGIWSLQISARAHLLLPCGRREGSVVRRQITVDALGGKKARRKPRASDRETC